MMVHALRILLWFFAGAYGMYVYFRHRQYVETLPDSPGGRTIKRLQGLLLAGSAVFLMTALWNVAKFLKSGW
jgi:hypothetical protein